jgi:hypothetical protein
MLLYERFKHVDLYRLKAWIGSSEPADGVDSPSLGVVQGAIGSPHEIECYGFIEMGNYQEIWGNRPGNKI